jgi:predicted DNA-binding ribbon-helix-helix protein
MESVIIKRSIVISGRKTTVSLERGFWKTLKEIANSRRMSLSDLVTSIDLEDQGSSLPSRLRLFVLDFYLSQRARERRAPKAPLRIVR